MACAAPLSDPLNPSRERVPGDRGKYRRDRRRLNQMLSEACCRCPQAIARVTRPVRAIRHRARAARARTIYAMPYPSMPVRPRLTNTSRGEGDRLGMHVDHLRGCRHLAVGLRMRFLPRLCARFVGLLRFLASL